MMLTEQVLRHLQQGNSVSVMAEPHTRSGKEVLVKSSSITSHGQKVEPKPLVNSVACSSGVLLNAYMKR